MTNSALVSEEAAQLLVGAYAILLVVSLIICVLTIIAEWKIFVKAGEAGWKCLIPVYGACVLSRIITGSMAKWLLCLIPIFGFFYGFVLDYKLCKCFGHGTGFFVGMIFLPTIFSLILAFDSSDYYGPQ